MKRIILFTRIIIILYILVHINLRAILGHLYVINATDDVWKIATYPNIIGEVSKPEKNIDVS